MVNLLFIFAVAEAAAAKNTQFPTLYFVVLGLGFVSAVTFGSIAWYNSKRPVGWEDKERPDIVPKVEKDKNPGLGTPDS